MSNWTNYVKQYSLEHGIPYGTALKKAAPSYHQKYGGVVLGGKKKKSMSIKKKSDMMGMRKIKKRKSMRGGMNEEKAYDIGRDLYDVLGGGKGALAALLSGLDARVNIK